MYSDYGIRNCSQDPNPRSHIHEVYEIFISLTDEGKFFLGDRSYPLSVGMTFFLNPFEIHHCVSHGEEKYDRYVLHFTREHLRELSTEKTDVLAMFEGAPLVQHLSGELLERILRQLAVLTKEAPDIWGVDVECHLAFSRALLLIARAISEGSTHAPIPLEHDTRVNDILTYIHRHYAENITLDDLAAHSFISKSRLSKIFKDTTGFSVGNYIIIYRIKRACALLTLGERVQDVGQLVGFKNNTHFIRAFKQHIGCSPGRFARNPRGEKGSNLPC